MKGTLGGSQDGGGPAGLREVETVEVEPRRRVPVLEEEAGDGRRRWRRW